MILDDLGSDSNSEWQIGILFTLINERWASDLPTIITTNLRDEEVLEKLGDRIHSRLFDSDNLHFTDWATNYRTQKKKK